MDVVGGIASISQLVAYAHSAAKRLMELYKAAQEGPAFCREQRFNIQFLLQSVQRICGLEGQDIDSLLPLLIAIVDLATLLLNLLGPQGVLRNKWLLFSKSGEIEKAFRSLGERRNLLQFHIMERTYAMIGDDSKKRRELGKSVGDGQPMKDSSSSPKRTSTLNVVHPKPIGSPNSIPNPEMKKPGHFTLKTSNNQTTGQARSNIGNGWGKYSGSAEMIHQDNHASQTSEQNLGNADQGRK